MKVKCIKLLNADGHQEESSAWLNLNQIYHVLALSIDTHKQFYYLIVTAHLQGHWPIMVAIQAECFEIVSTYIPSTWKPWIMENGEVGISPLSWQSEDFSERFYDRDPEVYSIFERERDIILKEDP